MVAVVVAIVDLRCDIQQARLTFLMHAVDVKKVRGSRVKRERERERSGREREVEREREIERQRENMNTNILFTLVGW